MSDTLSKQEENELDEILSKLERYCYNHKLPMIACVGTGDGESEKDFRTRMVSCAIAGRQLKDDRIASMACIFNGFQAVPPRSNMDFDIDEII